MASSYEHLRCPGCDGTLEYVKDKKAWVCIYCGNEIRRKEEYDGLYTIKNVVKQVLVDLAEERLDSAKKNLVECQKISSDYVGTLIAEICVKVFTLNTPGACKQSERKGISGRIERLYGRLEEVSDGGISAEEEGLYESFNGNGEAFGVLILVYDIIQARGHLEFVLNFFDASTVYSETLNASLLNYALKNDKWDIADKIFENADNIDCRDALFILLKSYEDSEIKRQRIVPIMNRAEFRGEDYKAVREYIDNTADGVETKVLVYKNAVSHRIAPPMQSVVEHILKDPKIIDSQITDVYQAFCSTKPRDAELYGLIADIYAKHPGRTANREMQELLDNGIFIKLSDKAVKVMISRKELSVDERLGLLEKAEKCKLSTRDNDAILAEILLRTDEDFGTRVRFVQKMTEYVDTVSTKVLTEYIVDSTIDGENKPTMLEELLKLNLNMSYFRDLLNQYMRKSKDSAETKRSVSQLLSNQGISVDSDLLLELATSAGADDYLEKAGYIQKSIQNGTRISADCLSQYLERVAPYNYHSEIISLITTPASRVTDKALANYVLYANENIETKLQNAMVFAKMNGRPFGDTNCEIRHLNATVRCNLFQGYVLIADDSAAAVEAMTAAMKNARAKLNSIIYVNGQSQKFKKYIMENKSNLSPLTLTLCEQNNVFSLFF